jgi:hypothetical protein
LLSEVRIRELESLLCSALERTSAAEQEQQKLSGRMDELRQLSEKKDQFLQNAKMIQKLRDNELAQLKQKATAADAKSGKGAAAAQPADAKMAALQQELKILKQQVKRKERE